MSQPEPVQMTVDGDIVVIVVDNPPVNTITAAVRAALGKALDRIATLPNLRAVLLRCEGRTFFSGADINEFSGPPKEAEYRALFARFETLPIPVVAAMHGTVLGGGVEFSLACHYRIALPGTRFGMPEVTLGVIPGAGGTQRLPRLLGIERALDLVISAKPIDAEAALGIGLIDALVEGELADGALAWVRALLARGGGARPTAARHVEPVGEPVLGALRERARREYPNRTAALTAIEAVTAAARLPLAEGLLFEEKLANETKVTPECLGSVHVFFAERETRRVIGLAEAAARSVGSVGIVGAGTMGGGIAMCFANAGIPVTLIDATQAALDHGIKVIDRNYESMVKRGRLTAADKTQRLALIRPALDYGALGPADLVIEAVYEDMALKQDIFRRLDKVLKPGAILASNTSTLDVTEMARATSRPSDVIGMHFFSPANVMPLLEVVRTELTGAATIRTVMELAKPLRKTPVLVRVCYGFVGNRMMEGYLREAERMVLEGADPRRVDGVLERFGMAMGILAVVDMAGVDVGVNVHKANAERYPPDPSYYQADFALAEAGRLGQKNGKGYYRYEPGDRTRHDDPEAIAILAARARQLSITPREHTDQEILERCLFPLMNEGFRILEEGIAQRAGDIDVVWCAGYGFPRYRGGPMFFAETMGLQALYQGMVKYRQLFGPMHWQPAPLLEQLAGSGQSIYDSVASRAGGV
jgi:3-hydroxyacyl-CoA dehydrogenase